MMTNKLAQSFRLLSARAGRGVLSAGAASLVAFFALSAPAQALESKSSAPPARFVAAQKTAAQQALVLQREKDGFTARACNDASCDPRSDGVLLRLPERFHAGLAAAKSEELVLAGGKRIALIRVEASRSTFELLLAAPGKESNRPQVIYSGATDTSATFKRGLSVLPGAAGAQVRLSRELSVCGKWARAGEKRLDPKTLTLVDEPAADPLVSSRDKATKLTVNKVDESAAVLLPILRARMASGGDADLAFDGDPKTAWVDAGPGKFSTVVLRSASKVALQGLRLRFGSAAGPLVAPKRLSVLVAENVFDLTLPANLEQSSYSVRFPKPIAAECVAVVAELGNGSLALAEIGAETAFDGVSLSALVAGLSAGGDAAQQKFVALESSGALGEQAVIDGYEALDGPGRDLARRMIDTLPCDRKMTLYGKLLAGADPDERERARDRSRRCGKDSAGVLLGMLQSNSGLGTTGTTARGVLAEEAVISHAKQALPPVFDRLDAGGTSDERRAFRRAVAKALVREAGKRELSDALGDPSFAERPLAGRVEVLRALGAEASEIQGARSAFAGAADAATEFRERFLLIEPAAALAASGDERARGFLERALADGGEKQLRVRAARLAGTIPALSTLLLASLEDPEVRVREAALQALADRPALEAAATARVLTMLIKDPWTFIRRSSAAALTKSGADASLDASLAQAVDFEPMPVVRAAMLRTLAARGAGPAKQVVSERAHDTREALEVRVSAVDAIGSLCDAAERDFLTELVQRGAQPLSEADRKLALAAIATLGRLGPADLSQRLAVVSAEGVPADIRDAAKRSMASDAKACKP